MLAGLVLLSVLSQGDPSEWAAPQSFPDAGVPAAPAEQATAEEPEVVKPAPDPVRLTLGHFALALMGTVGESGYFAVRVEGGVVFGRPWRISDHHAMGPSIGIAADLLAAKLRAPSCGTAGLCASRYQGGLAVRGAWNWGAIGNDGIVAPVHSVFLQAVGFLSSNVIPSAPLSPGNIWGEHGVRFDLGLISGFLRGSWWPRPGTFVLGGGLYAALSLEWLIANSPETGRFRFGLSAGVGI
jgi:hypothetical protein